MRRKRAKFVYVDPRRALRDHVRVPRRRLGLDGGLDQLFQGLNIFHRGGNPVSKAQKHIKDHPKDPQGFRELATAYESKGDNGNAISALQQYTSMKPKDAKSLERARRPADEPGDGLRAAVPGRVPEPAARGRRASRSCRRASSARRSARTRSSRPRRQRADAAVQDLQQRTQLAYTNAVASYEAVTQLTPNDSNAWFSLAQAAQQAGQLHLGRHGVQALPQAQPRARRAAARSRR